MAQSRNLNRLFTSTLSTLSSNGRVHDEINQNNQSQQADKLVQERKKRQIQKQIEKNRIWKESLQTLSNITVLDRPAERTIKEQFKGLQNKHEACAFKIGSNSYSV
mgnify:CR=1 FL=1